MSEKIKATCGNCISFEPSFSKAWCSLLKKNVMANDPDCGQWDTDDPELLKKIEKAKIDWDLF